MIKLRPLESIDSNDVEFISLNKIPIGISLAAGGTLLFLLDATLFLHQLHYRLRCAVINSAFFGSLK